jgi:hypothetical protein
MTVGLEYAYFRRGRPPDGGKALGGIPAGSGVERGVLRALSCKSDRMEAGEPAPQLDRSHQNAACQNWT